MTLRINRVYTRSGDGGQTSLADGSRVAKSNIRINACGEIDELSAVLGLLKESLSEECLELVCHIENIQQDLFDIGGLLARQEVGVVDSICDYFEQRVRGFEELCDTYGRELPELTSFILPGGNQGSAMCHFARALARRTERSVVALDQHCSQTGVASVVLGYLNRLSDLLFVFARWTAQKGQAKETLWIKPEKRLKRSGEG